jgi:adenosylmethionine-8-amino-7-oxononanoate aminotransferase
MPDRLDKAQKARTKIFGVLSALPPDLVCDHGEGVYIFDQNGRKYLDFSGSPQACSIGHGDQRVTEAVAAQMKKIALCFQTFFINEKEGELAERVLRRAPKNMARIQFVNSGSEATESAIKLAHQFHIENGKPMKHLVISRWQGYHGMTVAALSASGYTSRRAKLGTLLHSWPKIDAPLCYRCPYELTYPRCKVLCARALDRLINQLGADYVSAFIAEPIGGAGSGAMVPVPEYYPMIREICDKHDVLFIDDEVICGFGRTGKWFGIDHWNMQPDIITTAKGMSGAYTPIAAVMLSNRIADVFEKKGGRFINAYTTAGNPVSCAAALAVVDIIEKGKLVERSATLGDYLHKQAKKKLANHPTVGDIRGRGLHMGIEIVKDKKTREPFEPSVMAASRINKLAMEKGCMVFPTTGTVEGVKGDVIMMAPPYIITKEEIDLGLDMVDEAITEFEKQALK